MNKNGKARVILKEKRIDGAQVFLDLDTLETIWLSADQAFPELEVGASGTLSKTVGKYIVITKGGKK